MERDEIKDIYVQRNELSALRSAILNDPTFKNSKDKYKEEINDILKSSTSDVERLRNAAKLKIEQQKAQLTEPKTPLTKETIDKILNAIPDIPSRHPHKDEYMKRYKDILRGALSKVYVVGDDYDFLIKYIKEKSMKSWITPGTPFGLSVSDDLGAASMQGALNARHTAGKRQNASGGIKAQREIILLSTRKFPTVMVAFEERQTFRSIMDEWRARLVGARLIDLISSKDDIIIEDVQKVANPSWYTNFMSAYDIDLTRYVHTKRLVVKLNKDKLFTYKVNLDNVKDKLEDLMHSRHRDQFVVLFSNPLNDMVELHIIPNDDHVKDQVIEETLRSDFLLESWKDDLFNTTISGIEGVKNILPVSRKVLDGVKEVITGGIATLTVSNIHYQYYGITSTHIKDLFVKAEIAENTITLVDERVLNVKVPPFNPILWLSSRVTDKTPSFTQEQRNGKWLLTLANKADEENLIALLKSMSELEVETSNGIYIKSPKISVLKEVKTLLSHEIEARIQLEENIRTRRTNNNTNESLITPLSDIESMSEIYFAELSGGTFEQILYVQGVDIYRSYSNNPKEMNVLLGIEACRKFLTLEIDETWSNGGTPLQPHSITTTADSMCYRGSLTPSSHNGITSNPIGFLSKATVHAATKWLTQAGLNNEKDRLQSASACLMVGKKIKHGTGIVLVKQEEEWVEQEEEDDSQYDDVQGEEEFIGLDDE